ncbi:MAG: TetR/AcrR family transcriptional regulator [Actinomycetota bacterium]
MSAIQRTATRRRPGGRTARVRASVLKAFLEELADRGFASISFEGVADRAGVHKTTLYRRWPNTNALLREAARELSANGSSSPDSGTFRDDLRMLARKAAASLRSPLAEAMLRAVVAEANGDPELAEVARRYWGTRLDLAADIVRRAVERAEVPLSTDPHLLIETLLGPIYLRALVMQEAVDEAYIERLVDETVARATR